MRPENLEKMKSALIDEFGFSEKLADYCAMIALEAVYKSLRNMVMDMFEDTEE